MRRFVVAIVVAAGCGESGDRPLPVEREPARRVIEPPQRDIRALPPHAISAEGVGPYKLGMPMAKILSSLPSGPRIALLQIPGVLDYSVVRDDGLVVGGERQGDTSFIAVLRPGIARNADGVGVGATAAALAKSLGPPDADPTIARDPHVWVGRGLPGARFLLGGDRVAAAVLAAPRAAVEVDTGTTACARSTPPADALVGIGPAPAALRGACLDGADAVMAVGDLIAVVTTAEEKPRRVAQLEVPGLRWVAPLRTNPGRDVLVAVSQRGRADGRTMVVTALAVEGGRLVKIGETDAYTLTETSAAWIGATLADVELYLEVAREDTDDLLIGGVLVHGAAGQPATVAPLQPVTLRTSRRVADADRERAPKDAGVPDAGAPRDAPGDGP